MKINKRGNLSPVEQEEIVRLNREEGLSTRKIAKVFGCSHVTVSRVLKKAKDNPTPSAQALPPKPVPPPITRPDVEPPSPIEKIPDSRIEFRAGKLIEVANDIQATRLRGSVHVLPALHRLHLQIHDELSTMRSEAEEITGGMDAQGLVATISQTIQRLPPILRHQLRDSLEEIPGRVIQLQDKISDAG